MSPSYKKPKHKQEPVISKKPRQIEEPSKGKIPKHIPIDWHSFSPAWNISFLDIDGEWGWDKVDKKILMGLIYTRLVEYENKTWHEILINSSKRNHRIPVKNLCPHAQKRLKELYQDDIDEVISLGLKSTERIYGIIDRNILKILWWDPDHNVCPCHLKNT